MTKDNLVLALERNGTFVRCAIRELESVRNNIDEGWSHVRRPDVFVDGVAVVSRLDNRNFFGPYLLLFLEKEPDAFYLFEPCKDTVLQLRGD